MYLNVILNIWKYNVQQIFFEKLEECHERQCFMHATSKYGRYCGG